MKAGGNRPAYLGRPPDVHYPSPTPTPSPPSWPCCGLGADPANDAVGCRGVKVAGHALCLAHLSETDRVAYFASLTPGDDVDHCGTTFTPDLHAGLLQALRDPTSGISRIGEAAFDAAVFEGAIDFGAANFGGLSSFTGATFAGDVRFVQTTFEETVFFSQATFEGTVKFMSVIAKGNLYFGQAVFKGDTWFELGTFERDATFSQATFEGYADFGWAIFKENAWFDEAIFRGKSWFGKATFHNRAMFRSAIFEDDTGFRATTFKNDVRFESTTFVSDAKFAMSIFEKADSFGPLICAGRVRLSGAVFRSPVTILLAARHLECRRTRWSSTAEIRVRHATVDFAHAVFEYPLTIAAQPEPFLLPSGTQVGEAPLAGEPDTAVRIASLRGVDAAHLVLADVDLSRCLFTGTVHLDQLRLEGACTFDTAPRIEHRRGWSLVRFTPRRILAEEHHWRASQPIAVRGWNVAVLNAGPVGPMQLAPVYRALRKGFEDGKHEPGAADFYYGEMEMRRHAGDIPRSERSLLTAYWALSGYGMRASRSLAWLCAAMFVTIMLLMGLGLPRNDPKQEVTGIVPANGGRITLEIAKDDPRNPTGNRFTGERFEKSLNVTLNSAVFRSADQDLTTAGTYIEMTSRLVEPALLALAVLAIRGRIKR
ncbi:pentapeptide repeat-containing protein [Streptomyces sp. NPDC088736]|uniref:pentapeptide repeat-containing protein n=1 Tax=Streptomyces sp. NPDC088736 TaxID=3365881 RepID=UPI003818C367